MSKIDQNLAGPSEWLSLAVLTLPVILLALDITILHLAIPSISAALVPTNTEMLWILDIYGFMIAGFLITMGALGDRFGSKKVLLCGASLFGVASILAAFSSTSGELIFFRALMGISGATLMPASLAIISYMFKDERQRIKAISIWMTGFLFGTAIGPIVGGIVLEFSWWGGAFLIGAPVMVLILLGGVFLLPKTNTDKSVPIDITSCILCVTAMLTLMYGIKDWALESIHIKNIASTLVGIVLSVVFIQRQLRMKKPMFDLRLFRIRAFSVSIGALLLTTFAFSGTWLVLVQYLQGVTGLSAFETGLTVLPVTLIQLISSLNVVKLAEKGAKALAIKGLILAAFGGLIIASAGQFSPWMLVAGMSFIAAGVMPIIILGTDIVVGSAPKERAGSAAATSETASELGIALGVAVIGSISSIIYQNNLLDTIPLAGDYGNAIDTLGATLDFSAGLAETKAQQLVNAAQQAFSVSMDYTGVIAFVTNALAAALVSLMLLRRKHNGEIAPTEPVQ